MEQDTSIVAPVEPTPVEPTPAEPAPEVNKNYEKLLSEKKNYQASNHQLKEELNDLRDRLKQREQKELESQQKFQELSELHKTEAQSWKSKYEQKEMEGINLHKKSAIRKTFKDSGYSDEQVNLFLENDVVKMDNVKYDNETGVVYGTEDAVAKIKSAFRPDQSANTPTMNADSPNLTPQDIDLESFKKMPLAEQRKNQEALYAKYGVKRRV